MDIDREVREIEQELAREDARGHIPKINDNRKTKFFLGLLLVLMISTYFLIDPQVQAVIVGFFESVRVDDDSFSYNEKKVIFEEKTWDRLTELFRENQENEFKSCLMGAVQDGNYLIKEILEPHIHFQSVYKVISNPCPDGTIIDLHSHPYKKCVASQQDLSTLNSLKEKNPEMLLAVMCTEKRISFYG